MSLQGNFIPGNLELQQWEDIEPYFASLEKETSSVNSDLRQLITNYSDVLSVYHENDVRVELAHERDLRNSAARALREKYVEEIHPQTEERTDRIEENILRHAQFSSLRTSEEYHTAYRIIKNNQRYQCAENIPIEREIRKVCERCEELLSRVTVPLSHGHVPVAEAEEALVTPDRTQREGIWIATQEAFLGIKAQLDGYFNALVQWRHRLGRKAGYRNYRSYEHDEPHPAHGIRDADRFHRFVEHEIAPLANDITRRHRQRLGLKGHILRPWDTNGCFWGFQAPAEGKPTLSFSSEKELIQHTTNVMHILHPDFGEKLRFMEERGLIDIASRPHKKYGSFCESLEVQGLPFIFAHGTKTYSDITRLSHEFGHAMHVFLTAEKPLIFSRYYSTDYTAAETASEMMELLGSSVWDQVHPHTALIARRDFLEEKIRLIPWAATVDKFQHWLYKNPRHSSAERDAYFASIMRRFSPTEINWKGLERYRKNYWQQIGHIYSSPFYYIQYAFAELAAIELYKRFIEAPEETLTAYREGLQAGAEKPYTTIWKSMGITLDFSPKGFDRSLRKIPELMSFVMHEIEKLDQEIARAI